MAVPLELSADLNDFAIAGEPWKPWAGMAEEAGQCGGSRSRDRSSKAISVVIKTNLFEKTYPNCTGEQLGMYKRKYLAAVGSQFAWGGK